MSISPLIFGALLLLFTVGDLIGQENLAAFETKWLSMSSKILFGWKTKLKLSSKWWPKLAKIAALQFASSIYLIPFFLFLWAVFTKKDPLWLLVLLGIIMCICGIIGINIFLINKQYIDELQKEMQLAEIPIDIHLSFITAKTPWNLIEMRVNYITECLKEGNKVPVKGIGIVILATIFFYGILLFLLTTISFLIKLILFFYYNSFLVYIFWTCIISKHYC